MVSCSSSSPPRGGKCSGPQPDNHRTQALQRPNECRTLPGRRGACFPRAVAGGFERRLETVFAVSYTRAVLTYGLTGSLARCWRRLDGDAYALPFMFHYPAFDGCGVGRLLLSVAICYGACYKRLPSVAFGIQTVTGARFSRGATPRRAIALAWMSTPSGRRRSGV